MKGTKLTPKYRRKNIVESAEIKATSIINQNLSSMEKGKSPGGIIWLDKKGAMAYIGISKRGLEYRMADGSVRYYQLKGKILFDRDELDEDIKRKKRTL